jgi:hypothetical protein
LRARALALRTPALALRGARASRRVGLAAFAASALLVAGAANASALLLHLPNGNTISVQPSRGAAAGSITSSTARLEYHGGPIMPSNTNYTLYWAPASAPPYPAEYKSGINQYLAKLAHDSGGHQNVDSVATQYNDAAGQFANYDSHFGGALLDTDAYPANGCAAAPICLTDRQIREELKTYIKANGLPHDHTHEYFVLTPPRVEDCFEATSLECSAGSTNPVYCAYHSYITLSGGPIIYANDPYVTGNLRCEDGEHPNNKPSDGALQGGLTHEHNESLTDPELNAWYDANGAENGDKCRTFNDTTEFGTPLGIAPDGSRYNQVVDASLYWYQQEWSNEGLACKQRLLGPTVTKVEPKSGLTLGGTRVTITGTRFAQATAVSFGSAAAASFTINSSTSITAISPAHAAAIVDITVTTPAGISAISLSDHFKFLPAVTSVTPNSGPRAGGTSVTISGSGFAPGTGTTIIHFGLAAAKNVICSSGKQCTATSPKHEAGTVHVSAIVNKVSSAKTSADLYTYT